VSRRLGATLSQTWQPSRSAALIARHADYRWRDTGRTTRPGVGELRWGVLRLPDPMLSRTAPLPLGSGWSYELKWDGFRVMPAVLDLPR
jgi:hypothetical protein